MTMIQHLFIGSLMRYSTHFVMMFIITQTYAKEVSHHCVLRDLNGVMIGL